MFVQKIHNTPQKKYQENEFFQVIRKIGNLAFRTLLSGNFLLQRQSVIKEIGWEVFDYGLLIGHNDFHKLVRDVTADIYVAFPHTSIQEFLGAFFFMCAIDDGESVEKLLSKHIQSFLARNPSFLYFCVWLLSGDAPSSTLRNKHDVFEKLVNYMVDLISSMNLSPDDIRSAVTKAGCENNEPLIKYWSRVLVHCQTSRIFYFGYQHLVDWAVGEVIDRLCPYLGPKLKTFNTIFTNHCQATRISMMSDITLQVTKSYDRYDYINKTLDCRINPIPYYDSKKVIAIIKYCGYLAKDPCLHVFSESCTDMLEQLQLSLKSLRALHFYCCVEVESFPTSPNLSRVTLCSQECERGTIEALCKAVKDGLMPRLSHLNLINCEMTSALTLLQPKWPNLTHLNLFSCSFVEQDFSTLFMTPHLSTEIFPRLTSLGLSFGQNYRDTLLLQKFVKFSWHMLAELFIVLANGQQFSDFALLLPKIPKIAVLGLCLEEYGKEIDMQKLQLEILDNLRDLSLRRFLVTGFDVSLLSEDLRRTHLRKLDLSGTPDLSGKLRLLFGKHFPLLETLILRHCKLDGDDLNSLAAAFHEHKIPEIKHLDVSGNFIHNQRYRLENFFAYSCNWNQLRNLNFMGTLTLSEELNTFVASGCLRTLHELTICICIYQQLGNYNPVGKSRKTLRLRL